MNRTIRAIIGVVLVLIITFSTISVFQNVGKMVKIDITDQKIYTLSDGTKAILGKLTQPIKIRLYYAETAALKGPDQIRFFNNYYQFVRELLEEYTAYAGGMVDFAVIDPRPFSEDEADAIRYGLKRFRVTEEESFFFGLVVQTQFGVEKSVPFFAPARQNFIEYDISYLIDTAITRQKSRVGIISSLPVTGDDVTPYMAQMMQMQGQTPKPAWTIVSQLKQKYDVTTIAADTEEIKDIDILMVIHPKDFPEKTLFAIDQFVLKGGKTIVCVDPHCLVDRPTQQQMQMGMISQASDLNVLLEKWGLQVPANTFAGDRSLAIRMSSGRSGLIQKNIGYLELTDEGKCFDPDSVVTANLSHVRLPFPGVIKEIDSTEEKEDGETAKDVLTKRPILMTTNRGNEWQVSSPFELMSPDLSSLMRKFTDGAKPAAIGYQVIGKFKSAFPEGIEITEEEKDDEGEKKVRKVTGITEATQDCVVTVYADVDFISDMDNIAYHSTIFGKTVVGDNASLFLNSVDDLTGSSDLITIRSRGNFTRPFIVVDKIEEQAERETTLEIQKLQTAIDGYNEELQKIVASAREGDGGLLGSSIIAKQREAELKKLEAQRELNKVNLGRRVKIDALGNKLKVINMMLAPIIILVIAITLGIFRSARKRHYISHASD